MATYPWNILYSKILPAKSCAWCRRPATQAAPSQTVHWNLATGPKLHHILDFYIIFWTFKYIKITPTHAYYKLSGNSDLHYSNARIQSKLNKTDHSLKYCKIVFKNSTVSVHIETLKK